MRAGHKTIRRYVQCRRPPRSRWLQHALALIACVAFAQAAAAASFGFDDVTAVARGIAAKPYKAPVDRLPPELRDLDYDALRDIRFKTDERALAQREAAVRADVPAHGPRLARAGGDPHDRPGPGAAGQVRSGAVRPTAATRSTRRSCATSASPASASTTRSTGRPTRTRSSSSPARAISARSARTRSTGCRRAAWRSTRPGRAARSSRISRSSGSRSRSAARTR